MHSVTPLQPNPEQLTVTYLTISDKTNTDLTEVIPGRHVTSNITDTTPYKTVIVDLTETTSDNDVQVTLTTDPTGTVPDKIVTTYLTAVTANLSGTAWDKTVTC